MIKQKSFSSFFHLPLPLFPMLFVQCAILTSCGPSPVLHHRRPFQIGLNSPLPGAAKAGPHAEAGTGVKGDSDGQSSSAVCQVRFPKNHLCVTIVFPKSPEVGKSSSFRLQFLSEPGNQPLRLAAAPAVDLWMPQMGHGSAPVKIAESGIGEFVVTDAYFLMAGLWQIRVKLGTSFIVSEEAVLNLQL